MHDHKLFIKEKVHIKNNTFPPMVSEKVWLPHYQQYNILLYFYIIFHYVADLVIFSFFGCSGQIVDFYNQNSYNKRN